jgi:hypothetical protein
MLLETKQDKAVYYWLKNLFADAPFVSVVDSFPTSGFTPPTVALEEDLITGVTFEMGNRQFAKVRTYYVDVFADNKNQRNEFAYRILNALEEKICVYDYDKGFPPTDIPKLGCLDVLEVSMKPIKIIPELTEKLYYRAVVTFTAEYQ